MFRFKDGTNVHSLSLNVVKTHGQVLNLLSHGQGLEPGYGGNGPGLFSLRDRTLNFPHTMSMTVPIH